MPTDAQLAAAPFHLDADAIAWVHKTFAGLSRAQKIGQVFMLISRGDAGPADMAAVDALIDLQPGGFTRFFGPDREVELAVMGKLRRGSAIPPLMSTDLEGSRMSLAFGTPVLNPLGLSAVDDVAATAEISRIMAEEARAIGINWSYSPALDINVAFRSSIVGTRSFGSDLERVERHALAQVEAFQRNGVAAAVKHWPGEGYDDRDQHLVTTINPLSLDEWESSFGRLYRRAIRAGVLSVMTAHIALPAFVRSFEPDAGIEAFRPASVSSLLNQVLLRERLGFNGLIVSDATPMAGLGAWTSRRNDKVELLQGGCDMVLFSENPQADMAAIDAALSDGTLPEERLDDAVLRVLGLKAALGLHKEAERSDDERRAALGTPANRAIAEAITARAPTLVKDTQDLLPLDPARHRRVLVFTPGIVHPLAPAPQPFILPDLLRQAGFEVTLHTPETEVSPAHFDLVLYLFGDEDLLTRSHIFIDWSKLTGGFGKSMTRYWHDIPTLMISFGHPYMLYDAPRVPTYINAYSTLDSVQQAVVKALLGNAAWNQNSPVDPFCGLEDARY